MQHNALGIFFSAFGGAMLLYIFRLAVEYRNDPERFEWAGWRDLLAQVGISLTITVITFLTLWKGTETDPPECRLIWYPYIKACTEAMMLEMFIHVNGGHRCTRQRTRNPNTTESAQTPASPEAAKPEARNGKSSNNEAANAKPNDQ